MKDTFATIGMLTIIFIIGFALFIAAVGIRNMIEEYRSTKRYEYMITHRFDGEPKAKCYCIDCKYCYGEPTESGSGVYCRLFHGSVVINDNSYCYRAEPKGKEAS